MLVCKESRWKNGVKHKVPCKVLRYFPITPRLQRLFVHEKTSRDTKWHKEVLKPDKDLLRHLANGEAWKSFDTVYPKFASDPRNLRLGLATDRFN